MLDPKEYAKQLIEKYKDIKIYKYPDEIPDYVARLYALIDVQNTIDALESLIDPFSSMIDATGLKAKDLIFKFNQVKEHIKQS